MTKEELLRDISLAVSQINHLQDDLVKTIGDYIKAEPENDGRSWISGYCKDCGYNVIVTQPNSEKYPAADYWWYCSNKQCKNHLGEHTGDMEHPNWRMKIPKDRK